MTEEQKIPNSLCIILACGALVRLALLAWCADLPIWTDDESDYNGLAVRLVERGAYCDSEGRPISLRPPLYPALVAACYWLFGKESYLSVRALQAALSLITVVFAYRMGTELYSRRVGAWSAGLCCFYPSLLVYNNLLLTEVLFTCLLTAACWAAVRAVRGAKVSHFLQAGVLLGLGALTRSVLWLSPPCLAFFVLLFWKAPPTKRIAAAFALCVAFAIVVAPWSVRNTRVQRTFTAIDVMGGRNLMMGNYEFTPLHRSWDAISIDGERAWHRVLASEHGPLRDMTQGQIDKLAMKAGVAFVREHPLLTLKRDAIKFLDFWQLEREVLAGASRGRFGPLPRWMLLLLAVVILGAYVGCVISAIFGMLATSAADWRPRVLLVMVLAFICGLHALVFGHSRYHLPLIPILAVYSAAALVDSRRIWNRRGDWRFGVACALSCAALAAWGYEIVAADLSAFHNALRLST